MERNWWLAVVSLASNYYNQDAHKLQQQGQLSGICLMMLGRSDPQGVLHPLPLCLDWSFAEWRATPLYEVVWSALYGSLKPRRQVQQSNCRSGMLCYGHLELPSLKIMSVIIRSPRPPSVLNNRKSSRRGCITGDWDSKLVLMISWEKKKSLSERLEIFPQIPTFSSVINNTALVTGCISLVPEITTKRTNNLGGFFLSLIYHYCCYYFFLLWYENIVGKFYNKAKHP